MAYSLKTDKALLAHFENAAMEVFAGQKFKNFLQEYMARKWLPIMLVSKAVLLTP